MGLSGDRGTWRAFAMHRPAATLQCNLECILRPTANARRTVAESVEDGVLTALDGGSKKQAVLFLGRCQAAMLGEDPEPGSPARRPS